MSVEVETQEPAPLETSPAIAASPAAASGRQPAWRMRRYQLTALFVAIVFVAAVVGNNFFSRQYSPDGAVRQYLSALQSGDANSAWSVIQVLAPSGSAQVSLIDRAALRAALASAKPDIKNFAITSTTISDSTTSMVDFSYDTSQGTKQAKFLVQRSGDNHFGIYPTWHLVIQPTLLQFSLPSGGGGVSIDGKSVSLPTGKSTVAVLPLGHKIQFVATSMLASQSLAVDTFFSLAQSVAYQPKLTDAGMLKAKAAVKAAFDACAKQTGLAPAGCPQSYSNAFASVTQWHVVGDPTQDLAIGSDLHSNLVAIGHFQMLVAYQEDGIDGTSHSASSGPYSAALSLSSADVSVTSVQAIAGAPGLQRPSGATDQAAKDLVTKAFAACASAKSWAPADCPQRLSAPDVSNVSWKLNGDPLGGSSVTFDQNSGLVMVKGSFAMTANFTVSGYPYSRDSYNTTYEADLLWDGQALQLVTISGDF